MHESQHEPRDVRAASSGLADARLLVALARGRSLSGAAAALGVTQQAASARLARLERALGVRIAARIPAGTRLLPEGVRLLRAATDLVAAAGRWTAATASLATGRREEARPDHVRIAASRTVVDFLLPGWLARARALGVDTADVGALPMNSRDVVRYTGDGVCELGFIETPRPRARELAGAEGLERAIVAWDELVLVVPPEHPWAHAGGVEPARLAATPLVLREEGSGTRETLERALPGGLTAPVMVLESSVAIRSAVIAGAGPAVLSVLVVERDIERGALVPVRILGRRLRRPITAVWRGRREALTELSRTLLAVAR